MRLRRAKKLSGIALAILGLGMLAIAFFAFELGLDNNRAMGGGRAFLACLGALSLALALIVAYSSRLGRLSSAIGRASCRAGARQAWAGRSTGWARPPNG